MSDYDLPDLPSDDELGITEDDIEAYEAEQTEGDGAAGEPAAEKPSPAAAPKAARAEAPPKAQAEPPKTEKAAPKAEEEGPPPPPAGPLRWAATLVFLIAAATLSAGWFAVPSPRPANAPESEFSSARAMTHLIQIARAAHPPGSPEHDRVREYILAELSVLGLEPTVQTTTSMLRQGAFVRAATVRNVVARIPGTDPTGAVLITAHYDGRELSRAAGDDGSGVVAILEALRALRTGPAPRNDVIVLITDGEELGLLGARAFVDQHPWMADVDVVLSFEMRGGAGPTIMFETGAKNGWIVRRLQEADPHPFTNGMAVEIYRRLPNDTDFTPFREAGAQGLNFAGIADAHVYHQVYDTPENLDEGTLQHQGARALALMRHLGEDDLNAVDAPDVVYFSVPFLGMVVYEAGWVLPISAILLIVAALTFLLVRRAGGGAVGIVAGLGGALVAGGLAWLGGDFLYGWLTRFHPESDALQGSAFHSEGWYLLGLAALALFLVTVTFSVLRRWWGAGELTFGALLVPLGGAIVLSFMVPLAAMNLQWPVLAALLATAATAHVRARRGPGSLSWGLALVLAVPVFVFMVFLVEFVWLGLNFSIAPALAVLLVATLVMVLPALDALRQPSALWTPVLSLAAAAAFVGLGILSASPSTERPLPSTLLFVQDNESGEAHWLTTLQDEAEQVDRSRAWAREAAGAPFDSTLSLTNLVGSGRPYAAADATPVEAQPYVEVVADSLTETGRELRVAVRSTIGAEMMRFEFQEEGEERLTAINFMPLPEAPERPLRVEHWGRPESAVFLDLTAPPGPATLDFTLTEHLFRPAELLGAEVFTRPPDLAPDIVSGSDRVIIRSHVAFDLDGGAVTPDSLAATSDSVPGP